LNTPKKIIQGSLFEDDYLVNSLGNIIRDSEYALTELVANAWDAGATTVNIEIPTQQGKIQSTSQDYPNWRKRPDLLLLPQSSLSAVALEDFDSRKDLATVRKVLLLELKKGESEISRKELNQAEEYIDGIRNCGCISSAFFTQCFVLGARVDVNVTMEKSLSSNGIEHAAIKGVCYSTLTQTATKRLFKLKERLEDRYAAVSQGNRSKILEELLSQQEMPLTPVP